MAPHFLTSALGGDEWSASRRTALSARIEPPVPVG
jgi:hypothetical protein